jgi:hypothetical protein
VASSIPAFAACLLRAWLCCCSSHRPRQAELGRQAKPWPRATPSDLPAARRSLMSEAAAQRGSVAQRERWGGGRTATMLLHKKDTSCQGLLCRAPRFDSHRPPTQGDTCTISHSLPTTRTTRILYLTAAPFEWKIAHGNEQARATRPSPHVLHQVREQVPLQMVHREVHQRPPSSPSCPPSTATAPLPCWSATCRAFQSR